jgi:transcriptional regulator with XRE-family HTH domain
MPLALGARYAHIAAPKSEQRSSDPREGGQSTVPCPRSSVPRRPPEGLAGWLRALQGRTPRRDVAVRSGCSSAQVGRWLRGEADPRLPQLLAVVDALTGRAGDWVAELVDLEQVPAVAGAVRDRRAVLGLVYREPWTAAILAGLSAAPPPDPIGWVADRLELPRDRVAALVKVLERGGVVSREAERYRAHGLTVDVPPDAEDVRRIRRHWAEVSAARVAAPRPDDRFGFNVCAVSRRDLERLLDLQAAYFREVRSIVAASEPEEAVALITMHTLVWG